MNNSQVIKLTEIRQFLMKNLIESKTMIVKLFNVNVNTLIIYMRRHQSNQQHQHEKHNKILKKHEKNAVHRFIKLLLVYHVLLIINVVFSDIVILKIAYNSSSSSKS
jgi:hypothetical protein